ncbi:MAG: hypothetical protein ACHQIL_08845 [Steroidobacterales bacterium]
MLGMVVTLHSSLQATIKLLPRQKKPASPAALSEDLTRSDLLSEFGDLSFDSSDIDGIMQGYDVQNELDGFYHSGAAEHGGQSISPVEFRVPLDDIDHIPDAIPVETIDYSGRIRRSNCPIISLKDGLIENSIRPLDTNAKLPNPEIIHLA